MIYIIDEHNEAFFIFHKYLDGHTLKTLVHVDEHHDLGSPVVNSTYIDELNNICAQEHITYENLRNCDYIVPLAYQKFIKDVVWINNMKSAHFFEYEVKNVESLAPYSILQLTKNPKPNMFAKNAKMYFTNIEKEFPFDTKNHNIVLSIDLDYFSCSDHDGEYFELEITKEEYLKYKTGNIHPVKLSFGSRMNFHEIKNKYYLSYQAHDGPAENKRSNYTSIDKKIELFTKYLKESRINAKDIIICKSSVSNFTPKDQQSYILNSVMKCLNLIYNNMEVVILNGGENDKDK